jgi:aspartyl-tRNA(Asn)/glutamyl-tRNA(Gln) amidotransferase subunit A
MEIILSKKDIHTLSAVEISGDVTAGRTSAVDVTEAILSRVSEIDPLINAYTVVDAEGALDAARNVDAEIAKGNTNLPLAGVPFSVKDLIPTKGVETAYGSHAMAGNIPDTDVTPIVQLKQAGAILIGKTTTPEFGCGVITGSPRHGYTRNPWNLERTSGGSSGGAAAAVAAGLGPIAVSTDGAGSSRIPASCCGILGMKGTLGLISNDYWPARFENYSSASMNARTVADLASLLSIMNGPGARDPWTMGQPQRSYPLAADPVSLLDGLRVTYVPRMGNRLVDQSVTTLIDITLAKLEDAGATVSILQPGFDWNLDLSGAIIGATLYARLAEVTETHRGQISPYLTQVIEAGRALSADAVKYAPLERTKLFDRVNDLFNKADLLVMPTLAAPAPKYDHDHGDPIVINGEDGGSLREGWYPYTRPFNLTGHPAISIPIGMTSETLSNDEAHGLPVGLQAVGPYFSEQRLLDLAAALEVLQPWANAWPELGLQKIVL